MKTKRIKVSSLLTVIGIALIAVACLSVVFSAISQNIGSKRAAEIAAGTVEAWLAAHPGKMERVIFNVFKEEDKKYYEQLLQ